MKRVCFNYLLVSSTFGLILTLSNHPGLAQQADKIDSAVPMPDMALPPPLTAKDVTTPIQAGPPMPAKPNEASAAERAATTPFKGTKMDAAPGGTGASDAKQVGADRMTVSPTTEPAVMTAPVFSSPVAEKLHNVITGEALARLVSRKEDREGIEAFYKERNYAPIWVDKAGSNARAKSVIAYLGRASEVGLDSADYPAPEMQSTASPDALADAEITLTNSALTFARHAQIGRIHFSRVAGDISFNLVPPDPAAVLIELSAGDDAGKVLDGFNPPNREFQGLRAKLAELRSQPAESLDKKEPAPAVRIREGRTLRQGMKDQRVIALRQRLNVPGDRNSPVYDEQVKEAVKAFQYSSGMNIDGTLGGSTVRALNGDERITPPSRDEIIDKIVVNMERWRWMPRDLGNPRVIVNVPDYTLTLWNDDQVYWRTKIVVGKPGKATPMTSAEMTHITVNPTWNVPPSIIEKEYLPALEQDPDALDRIGLRVWQDPDGTVHVSQPPGARNALGRIRFNFPNKFLVYQHDTPDKYLFTREKRAYSHGCMRVENPLTYGEKLLSLAMPEKNYTETKLKRMFGSNEINLNFEKRIWVHLTYQTAFVDEKGELQLRDDIYRRDAKMLSILKSKERKVADVAVYRRPDTSSKPVRLAPGELDGYGPSDGSNFMDWLFGGSRSGYRSRGYGGPRFLNGPHVFNGRYSAR